MLGILITGHGRFAEGLTSAIELIAGPQNHYVCVNFEKEVKELEEDLKEGLKALGACDGILVFTDLQGGSPFKTVVELTLGKENVEVVTGTNLAMLAEAVMARSFITDLRELTDVVVQTGKEHVLRFEEEALTIGLDEPEDFSEGI
ncbi:MAG: PTS sugar transporter subunit IIA [Faecalicoccus sp.]|nr:PTS sugar transporter subunit IIA [Faecalicoccus sp.]